jgi:hypothetical protein
LTGVSVFYMNGFSGGGLTVADGGTLHQQRRNDHS